LAAVVKVRVAINNRMGSRMFSRMRLGAPQWFGACARH
jgi:hypothetical protein